MEDIELMDIIFWGNYLCTHIITKLLYVNVYCYAKFYPRSYV